MKYLIILLLLELCSCNNQNEIKAEATVCCSFYPHPNFDCRTAWMKGKILTGNNQEIGYVKDNKDYYYRHYIESQETGWESVYKLDSAENAYRYVPPKIDSNWVITALNEDGTISWYDKRNPKKKYRGKELIK